MIYQYIFLALFALVSFTVAADPQIAFTSTPSAVVTGQTYTLTWSGGDGISPVTIKLGRGDSANLTWVAYLTTDATNGTFDWTVSTDMPNAGDYAFQIFESGNINNINYSARFSLSGGATATTTDQAGTGVGGGVGTGSSMGTGTALPRNTTFVAATLTPLSPSCSGLNGICVPTAAPTTTAGLTRTGQTTLQPVATATKTGSAEKARWSSKNGLMMAAVMVLGVL